ncbi:MAG: hypothetical protein LLG24_05105, partial [Actinomycetia bacterium]|nr:hypothetical protein [Actinomycetes bacterium]
IAGVPLATLREQARGETLREAAGYSAVLGVPVQDPPSAPGLVVVTGHQPELYHPGVWVKCFLAQRFSDETGAAALDIVVDSDTFDKVALETPCLKRGVGRCESVLARGGADVSFACAPPPSVEEVRAFRSAGLAGLQTLPAPALARHFCLFVDELEAAIVRANNLADAITIARRRYEAPAGTRYLELPVTRQARTQAFTRLVAHIALDAEHFAAVHNAELATYRRETGARSSAQPFPDLRAEHDAVELPFWWVAASGRRPLWVQTSTPALLVDGEVVLALDRDPELTHRALLRAGLPIAPRALTLTLFERLFVADLFIHGVGGGRYDQVTDAVIASYLGIEPPHFAVASLTLLLPLGGHEVTDDEIASAEQRLNRLRHNPDQLLGEIEFDTAEDRHHALALADEKRQLVQAIAQEGADKKMIGRRIREINEELAMLMSPLAEQAAADVERLRAQRETAEVLRDRSYPFCLWDPREVADKVR